MRRAKKYNLVFKVFVLGPKNSLLFIIFTNFYSIIDINKIYLGESFCLAKLIQ